MEVVQTLRPSKSRTGSSRRLPSGWHAIMAAGGPLPTSTIARCMATTRCNPCRGLRFETPNTKSLVRDNWLVDCNCTASLTYILIFFAAASASRTFHIWLSTVQHRAEKFFHSHHRLISGIINLGSPKSNHIIFRLHEASQTLSPISARISNVRNSRRKAVSFLPKKASSYPLSAPDRSSRICHGTHIMHITFC